LEGKLFKKPEEIPDYRDLNPDLHLLDKADDSKTALNSDIYRFFQAAAIYRNFVLFDLLPSYGLVVT